MRNWRLTFLSLVVTVTGVVLAINFSVVPAPFSAYLYLLPLFILFPSINTYLGRVNNLNKIVGYCRILERLILGVSPERFVGWENALIEEHEVYKIPEPEPSMTKKLRKKLQSVNWDWPLPRKKSDVAQKRWLDELPDARNRKMWRDVSVVNLLALPYALIAVSTLLFTIGACLSWPSEIWTGGLGLIVAIVWIVVIFEVLSLKKKEPQITKGLFSYDSYWYYWGQMILGKKEADQLIRNKSWLADLMNSAPLKITEPKDNAIVSNVTHIKGTSQGLPASSKIYVAIYHENRYYPLREAVALVVNGNWSVTHNFTNELMGERLDIVALSANQNTQQQIEKYLWDGRNSGSFLGLPMLPDGATRYHVVTVIQG